MLIHPTFDRLDALGLHGMAKASIDIEATGEANSLGHAEWLALLLEPEASLCHDKRLATRLRHTNLAIQVLTKPGWIGRKKARSTAVWGRSAVSGRR